MCISVIPFLHASSDENWRMGKLGSRQTFFRLKKWRARELKVGSAWACPSILQTTNSLGSYIVSWGDGNEFERTLSVFS